MKFLFCLFFSFLLWPCVAMGDALERCSLDLTVSSRRSFSEVGLANQWCSNIHRSFGFTNSCFVRQHDDGRWFGNFRHQRRFTGDSYDRIFRGYTQWSDRHLFRGVGFEHRIRFSDRCFGRSNGGGY